MLAGFLKLVCVLFLLAGCLLPSSAQAQQIREYPPQAYYLALEVLQEGEFASALRTFRTVSKSGIRSTEGRWVDSICYHAMQGECLYQMGEIRQAMVHYTAALHLFARFPQWMVRVDFEPLLPDSPPQRPATWGVSTRGAALGRFRNRYRILQGGFALLQTGIFAQQEYLLINAHEIVRCTALSIRRRRELTGATSRHDPLTSQVFQALSARPAQPNHWSQAWIDVQLGLAAAASGRVQQAMSDLQNGTLVGGTFDHPLTSTALLEFGKLAFEQEQYGTASTAFYEASIAAAAFEQAETVEEALRWGAKTHLVTGQPGPYPPLNAAAVWAHRESRFLEASVQLSAAENALSLNQTAAAASLAAQARRRLVRTEMSAGAVGGRLAYITAMVNYQAGRTKAGDAEFATLMKYQLKASRRRYEIELVSLLHTEGSIGDRVLNNLYGQVLREPTSKDWVTEPVETQSYLLAPLSGPLESWLQVALQRREYEQAVEIADRIRRNRFYATLPRGGRLLSLRWVLGAPDVALNERAILQRQTLFEQFPRFAELANRANGVRERLNALPLMPSDEAERSERLRWLNELATVSSEQELLLREIGLRRVAAQRVFPPPLDFNRMQASLSAGQAVLSFLTTSSGKVHAFMFGRDNYADPWVLSRVDEVQQGVSQLLRGFGLLDRNQPLDIDVLRDRKWQAFSARLLEQLLRGEATDGHIQELIVVPDGALWYLPFEALAVSETGDYAPLISRMRVRYAPTVALAVPDARPTSPLAETVIAAGKLFPRDEPEVALAAARELADGLPQATTLTAAPGVPGGLIAAFSERVVVFNDIEDNDPLPYSWSPLQVDRLKLGSRLADWMTFPWGGPQQVILPGFHTPAEVSLKEGGNGQRIFLGICGLMSNGARTILISRWRPGGQSTYDLVRELVQELPFSKAADAWQRSVQLLMDSELVLESEPRVRFDSLETGLDGRHPFFWAGNLLIDTGSSPRPKDTVTEAEPAPAS